MEDIEPPNHTPAPIINIQVPQEKDGWTIANKIAASSIAVTVLLIVVTIFLFLEAHRQTRAANLAASVADSALNVARNSMNSSDSTNREFLEKATQSADAAKRSADASLIADSIAGKNYILSQIAYENSKLDNKKRFDHDSASLQAQIASLDTAQKQFEVENTPYLELTGFKFLSFSPGKGMKFEYKINNLGRQPVKILTDSMGWGLTKFDVTDLNDSIFFYKPKDRVNSYLIRENSLPIIVGDSDNLTQEHYDEIVKEFYFVTIVERIEYINLITGKRRFYRFKAQMKPKPEDIDSLDPKSTDISVIDNDNSDIEETDKNK